MSKFDFMAIPLSQNLYALVDGKNYEWLMQWKWSAQKKRNTFRAVRNIWTPSSCETILMHRQILGLTKGDGKIIDHRNHCALDNREANLRICTNAQNQYNRLSHKNTSSKYKGVYWQKGKLHKGHQYKGKWMAKIGNNGKYTYLGLFDNEIEAAKVYDQKAKELFGDFAHTNERC